MIKLYITLSLFLSTFLFSCERNLKENIKKPSSFCKCFSASNIENFDERSNSCLTKELTRSELEELIISNIKSCNAVFMSIANYQDEMMRYGAKTRIKEYHQNDTTSLSEMYSFHQDSFILLNNFDSVLLYCEKLEEIEHDNPENLFSKGFAHEKLGQFDKAIATYKKMETITGSSTCNLLIAIAEMKNIKSK